MVTRRQIAFGLGAGLFAPFSAVGQQPGKVCRIGYMSVPSRQSAGDLIDGVFLPALRERGFGVVGEFQVQRAG